MTHENSIISPVLDLPTTSQTTEPILASLGPAEHLMGARVLPNGALDLSHAAIVSVAQATAEDEPSVSQSPDTVTGRDQAGERFEQVKSEAAQHGIDEQTMNDWLTTFHTLDKPFRQRMALLAPLQRLGLNMKASDALTLAKRYQKEKMQVEENGSLFHYHQTSVSNFDSIISQGALLSYEEQKRRETAGPSSGSRPDVVQFTRDQYDKDGNLVKAGLLNVDGIGAQTGVAFVFDESIMDEPDYDGIVEYPNVPMAPLSKLKAITISDEADRAHIERTLADKGISAPVVLQAEWVKRYEPKSQS